MISVVPAAALAMVVSSCSTPLSEVPPGARHGTTPTRPPATAPAATAPPSAVPTTTPTPVQPAPGWSRPLTALPPGGGFTSLSCISDTFCVAAGGGAGTTTSGSGVTVSWDGASWSDPSVYYPAPGSGPASAPILPAIACTGGPYCAIVDGSGHLSSGDGTNWSSPAALSPGAALPADPADPGTGQTDSPQAAVSCPTPAFCAVVDNTGHAYLLRDGHPLAPQAFGVPAGSGTSSLHHAGRVGVSCPSASACTAVVGAAVLDWNGTDWSEEPDPWTTGPVAGATAIACPTTALCVIVSGQRLSFRASGGPWSDPQTVDTTGSLDSISCPTVSFCLASDDNGSVVTWSGGSWSAPLRVLPTSTEYTGIGTDVSCPSPGFCMAIDADGDYATYSGSSPGTP